MNAQEMIERYAYAVARCLPPSRRADIRAELTGLLREEVAARAEAGEPERDAARAVILGFGPPRTAAQHYQSTAPVIEPRDTRLFWKIAVSVVAALCILATSVVLSDPAADNDPAFGRGVAEEAVLAGLQVLGLLLIAFWGLGAWHRRAPSRPWSPDRLAPVADPDAVNWPLTVLAVGFWTAGLAVLVAGPATLIEALLGGSAPAPLIEAFAYDADFVGLRSTLLWTALAVSIAIYAWPLVPGRRSPFLRRVDAVATLALSLLLYAIVLAGGVFANEPADEYMKIAMAIFAGWGLIEGGSGLLRERGRHSTLEAA